MPRPSAHHKGLLLVATYGTGKTHFMSCIAGVAVNAELAADLTDAPTAEAAAAIARKFGVIRVEIGAVQMSLRDIPATELTKGLAELGVEYSSPPLDKVTNNKQPVQQMMAASGERYPEHGLLLAIDELLDHLRTRRDMAIAFDPVHPAYLCTFEALTIVEERRVLSASDGAPRRRGSRRNDKPQ